MKILISLFLLLISSFQAYCSDEPIDDLQEVRFTSTFIEANKQKMLGMHSEALELYFDCLEIDPQSSASMFEIARLLYSQRDTEGAIAVLEKAVSINSTIDVYQLFLVQLYVETRKYSKALSLSETLIKANPYELSNYLVVSTIYCQTNNYSKAKKTLAKAQSIFGYDDMLVDEILKCELQFGKRDNLYKYLNTLIAHYPEETRYQYMLAETFIQFKNYDEALAIYDHLLMVDYDTTNIHLAKLDIFILLNDEKRFIEELQYIFSDPNVDIAIKVETLVKLSNSNPPILSEDQYFDYVQQLFLLYPDNLFVRIAMSEYYIGQDMYEEVLPHLYFIIHHDITKAAVFEHIIFIENSFHNWDSVYSVSKMALDYFPTNPFFYYYNGFSAYQLAEYNASVDVLMSGLNYLDTDELRVEFYTQIAESYHKLGSLKLSHQFYEKALTISPTNSLILNNYSYYLSVDAYMLDKALEMTILSNRLSPDNPIYLDTYAWVLYQMKRYDDARDIIQRSYDLGGNTISEVVEHFGDILFQLGKVDMAIRYWNEALQLEGASSGLQTKIDTRQVN